MHAETLRSLGFGRRQIAQIYAQYDSVYSFDMSNLVETYLETEIGTYLSRIMPYITKITHICCDGTCISSSIMVHSVSLHMNK